MPMPRRTSILAVAALGGGLAVSAPTAADATPCSTVKVTNQAQYDALFSESLANDTRSTGYHELQADGLRVWTESNTTTDKATGYHDLSSPVPLADQTAQSDYVMTIDNTSGGGVPGYQLVIDFDGDTLPDGILVGEEIYGDDWWATNGSKQFVKDGAPSNESGFGSEYHGTLEQWSAAFPDAQILTFGYSLGSGVKGDLLLQQLTFGCTTYVFAEKNLPPKASFWVGNAGDRNYRTFSVNARQSSDPEGAALTYRWSFGDGTYGTGMKLKHTYPARNRTYTVTLTVSDGTNTATTTRKITVRR